MALHSLYCADVPLKNCSLTHTMNAEQRQTAADLWIKPTDLNHWPACMMLGNRHLLLLSPKADTHLPSHRGLVT